MASKHSMYRPVRHLPPNTLPKGYLSHRLSRRFHNRAVLTFMANTPSLQHLVDYDIGELLTYIICDKLSGDEERLKRINKVRRNITYIRYSYTPVDVPKTNFDRVIFVFRNFDKIMDALVKSDILVEDGDLLYYDITTNTILTKEVVDEKGLRPCMADLAFTPFESVFGAQNGGTKLPKLLYSRLDPGGVYGLQDYYKNDFLFPLGNCYKVQKKLSNLVYTGQEYHDLTCPVNCRQYVPDMIALYTAELFIAHVAVTESQRPPGTRPLTRSTMAKRSPVTRYFELKMFARILMYLMQFEVVGYESIITDYKNLINDIYSTDYFPDNVYTEYNIKCPDEARFRGCCLTGAERLLVEFLESFFTNTSMFLPFKKNYRNNANFQILDRWKNALGKAQLDRGSLNSGKCCDCYQNVFSTRAHLCMRHKEIYYIKYFDFTNCNSDFAPGYILMELDMHRLKVRPSKFLTWHIEVDYDTENLTQFDLHLYLDYITEVELSHTFVFGAIGKGINSPKFKTLVLLES